VEELLAVLLHAKSGQPVAHHGSCKERGGGGVGDSSSGRSSDDQVEQSRVLFSDED
jgi:hypothetical protein